MSKENYINHNFVTNYAYEIYREDGSLREKYEPEAKADCEGTFKIDIKDKNGRLKEHEEKPIRSFTYYITGKSNVKTTPSYFPSLYPLGSSPTNSRVLLNRYYWNADSALGFGGDYGYRGGIYICNKSGSAPFYTFSSWSGGNAASHNYTIVENYPHLSPNGESIDFSFSRTCIMSSAGSVTSAQCIGIAVGASTANCAVADSFSETKSWNIGDSVKITYQFSLPTSNNSTITRNLIHDLFSNIILNAKFKDKTGSEIGLKRFTTQDYRKGLPNLDYINSSLNDTNKGIVLGSSNSNVSWEDYSLNSEFLTTELQPQASDNSDYTQAQNSGNTIWCSYARNFKNISEHDITIREAGVYSYATDTTRSVEQAGSFLLAHWLTGDVVVHPGETIRVYWKPTIVVS